ncbi:MULTISPECIES: DUF423 domain-containing protein [Mesonia]|uniref:Uncharacterized protein n=1 Tax=Mesonia oceanica TaxID=2687242 RepID=A0AC61Y688_9FLAO|nr:MULTISPECIES: DUF423 domain-containing protein [Mesonia]MAN29028.1 hypothetical protein [Mesonia sp.]MAQ42809.1 hypothetical protein [Mesonia sp.]MBJ99348.1 hypothetical protein [Flavobacteriaceae bacterium]VVU99652.1 hypothetical protein FVB9532_00908 [Mesonia oceanica]|tara:strand:+ start:3326 stop:3715 length:390 start_codon:yes stop_codon:yes gene_type:complete
MQRNLLILGCVLGMLAVILGAFGAHGLKEVLSEESLTSYETGVRYQFYHAFLALIVANSSFFTSKTKNIVFYLILVGVILFSGSIYLLSTYALTGVSFKSIAFITPVGGLLLILAWLLLFVNLLRMNKK